MIRVFGWSAAIDRDLGGDRAVHASVSYSPSGKVIRSDTMNPRMGLAGSFEPEWTPVLPNDGGLRLLLSVPNIRSFAWTLSGPTVLSVECTGKDERDEVIAELADALERYAEDVAPSCRDRETPALIEKARGLIR